MRGPKAYTSRRGAEQVQHGIVLGLLELPGHDDPD